MAKPHSGGTAFVITVNLYARTLSPVRPVVRYLRPGDANTPGRFVCFLLRGRRTPS
ncbi:GD18347 [Drosophila simulans]|uniref:GD18347 n=1 Tax=Drosophila simulans TaxID=7240 RepID=B4R258_DROSI|nr:GD18347 [Drosophila simulans]